jgi:hypothetical protein
VVSPRNIPSFVDGAGALRSSRTRCPPIVNLIWIKVCAVRWTDIRFMSAMIIFRCPRTGMKVQTLLSKQANEPRAYEIVTCPACTQFHFINRATGKALGDSTE